MPVLEFGEVRYEASGLDILRGVSGYAQSGKLLALMGASGAGKTTLLDILAHRPMQGVVSGRITLDGQRLSQRKFKKMAGYVQQDDVLLNAATVRETLAFAARMRCAHLSPAGVEERVQKVMEELGLTKRADAMVGGGSIRGLSGGEKRRVSVGLELVTDCTMLFLDEPTSGLDSNTAESVMQCLVNIAEKGRMVICTIHQPNSDITAMFNDFMLLAAGQVVYFGPWSAAVERFAGAGYNCPLYSNPTDYFIKVVTDANAVTALVEAQARWWKEEGQTQQEERVEEDRRLTRMLSERTDEDAAQGIHAVGFLPAVKIIAGRFLKQWVRDPDMFYSEFVQYCFYGIFMGLLYLGLSDKADVGSFERTASLFFILSILCFTPPFTVITVFENERKLMLRERSTGLYDMPSYFVAKTVVSWPIEVCFCLVFATISYFMIGFQEEAAKFFTFLGILVVFQLVCESVGLVCATGTSNATFAIICMSLTLIVLLSLSGFLTAELPVYLEWISTINFFKYALMALLKNEMTGLELEVGGGAKVDAVDLIGDELETDLSVAALTAVLIGYLVFFRLLAFVMLWKQGVKKSWSQLLQGWLRLGPQQQKTQDSRRDSQASVGSPGVELTTGNTGEPSV